MTASAIDESEALTLDFNKLAKGAGVPGVQPCAAHIRTREAPEEHAGAASGWRYANSLI